MKPHADNLLKNPMLEQRIFSTRLKVGLLFTVVSTFLLVCRLYYLQIIEVARYGARAQSNCIRCVPIAPARGIIYDRHGHVLAENQTIQVLYATAGWLKNQEQEVLELFDSLNLQVPPHWKRIKQLAQRHPTQARLPIYSELTDAEMARFALVQHRFPACALVAETRRAYPYGAACAHILGYLSPATSSDLKKLGCSSERRRQLPSVLIGRSGIEASYENQLRGQPGYETIEVNNRGVVQRTLILQTPVSGQALHLSIDIDLQQHVHRLLQGKKGAIVVQKIETGEVLALCSAPSFDPNRFTQKKNSAAYPPLHTLQDAPFFNRATQGQYPPGSTIKPFIALAALSEGIITSRTIIQDPGYWLLPFSDKRYRDWKRHGHGAVDLTTALAVSCDTFFYEIAYRLGIHRLVKWMNFFGFGLKTGLELPGETAGLLPTPEWKRKRYGERWFLGDTIPVGIGQGYWSATPIQLSNALVHFLNLGRPVQPTLIKRNPAIQRIITSENLIRLPAPCPFALRRQEDWVAVHEGMRAVTQWTRGTGYRAFKTATYKVGLKTGTSQTQALPQQQEKNNSACTLQADHALTIGYAPYHAPKFAVVVLLEHGGGGNNAALIARKLFDYLLLNTATEHP